MTIVGLTGGIGSGKSTVARMLSELGARVIDADRIGHEVYLPGTPGFDRVVERFGQEVVARDGTIDRPALGKRVFADRAALADLNHIVHPLIGAEILSQLSKAEADDRTMPVVIEAALLLDSGMRQLANTIWVVVAARELVVERLERDRNMSATDIAARVDAQITDVERRRLADIVIENTGSLDELRRAVEARWADLIGGAGT